MVFDTAVAGRTRKVSAECHDGAKNHCVMCHDRPPAVVLIPCGHYGLCLDCSLEIVGGCPICRAQVNAVVDVSISENAPMFSTCRGCHGGRIDTLLLPCGHANICRRCADCSATCIQCPRHIDNAVKVLHCNAVTE